jgi:hypothetical protein
MLRIKQDKIEPAGSDPEPPSALKRHLFENPDILSQSDKQLPFGQGTAVVGNVS